MPLRRVFHICFYTFQSAARGLHVVLVITGFYRGQGIPELVLVVILVVIHLVRENSTGRW